MNCMNGIFESEGPAAKNGTCSSQFESLLNCKGPNAGSSCTLSFLEPSACAYTFVSVDLVYFPSFCHIRPEHDVLIFRFQGDKIG
jgi:hypothetical protein